MLILTRKTGQKIFIRNVNTGETIEVCLVETTSGKARIGIEATLDWEILRDDAIDKKPKEV